MNLYIMTGPIQTGKTSWVARMLPVAAKRGLRVTGVWTPAIFEDGVKTGINTQLLPSGCEFMLAAKRVFEPGEHPDMYGKLGWEFYDSAMQRVNEHLDGLNGDYGDLFLVDEFGALEFYQDKGYMSGMRIMDEGLPNNVLLVLRPDLVELAQERWGKAQVMGIDASVEDFLDQL